MSIRIEYGLEPTLKLAQLAGQAEAAQVAAQQAQQIAQEQIRAQNDLAMSEFRGQLDLEMQRRAEAWDLEKMELASRNDFEMAEMQRKFEVEDQIRKEKERRDEIESGLKAIQESDMFTDEQKQRESYNFVMRKQFGVAIPAQKTLTPEQELQEMMLKPIGLITDSTGI